MTLTDRQAFNLEMEFLEHDLGRLPATTPAAAAKRELTRALYERATADEGVSPRPLILAAHAAIQDAVRAVVAALDKVVTAWEASTVVSKGQPQIVDGVRTAAAFIAEAAERAGLTMPAQPTPQQPGDHAAAADRPASPAAGRMIVGSNAADEQEVPDLLGALQASLNRHRAAREAAAGGQPVAEWTPSDGGRTPSMFGGI